MTLIEQINARAHDPKRAIDEGQGVRDAQGRPVVFVAHPPATEAQVAAAEQRLGFPLPELLRRLYREVGDGGFGPGYGLWGVSAAPHGGGGTVVEQYLAARGEKPQGPRGKSPRPAWPTGLLPICTFGCGITSCLDCSKPEAPVIRLDPNMPRGDVAERVPPALHFDRAAQVPDACWVEHASLEGWLQDWVDGKNLFYAAYGAEADEEDDDWDGEEDEGEEDEPEHA